MTLFSSCADGLRTTVSTAPATSAALAFILLGLIVKFYLSNRSRALNLPVIGTPGTNFGKEELLEGCQKYPNSPFVLPMSPPLVVLPISVLDEVRLLPEEKVSFHEDVRRMFLSKHTGIGETRPEIIQSVKIDLTRNIAGSTDGLQDEVHYSFNKELGECKDWTSVYLYPTVLRIVALLSGRVFVGRPLSREEAWIQSSINYTVDCVAAAEAARRYPSWMRGLVAGYLPEIKRAKEHKIHGAKLLEPILEAQLSKKGNEKIQSEESGDEQGTFISWIIKNTPDDQRANPVRLAENQMILSFAAIHTTSMAMCHAIYDLVSRREYIQPLRDELDKVLAEDGQDTDGEGFLILKKQSLSKLRKLDSFLKESQRLSPPSYMSHSRITTAPLKLSTGHTIPSGTRISFPSYVVHTSTDSTTYSPSYNPASNKPPSEFDGFRFSNLRAMEGKENLHQFVTTSSESLIFGHGVHACPGRFFASNEIKVAMIELLRGWDFRLKGDTELAGGVEKRPKNSVNQLGVTPNFAAEIEFIRRKI